MDIIFVYLFSDEWWFILVAIVIISLLLVNWLAKEARAHLSTGSSLGIKCWIPMFMAMFISSLSGFILSYSVIRFDDIAAYQPLVNGVGGNIAAIQASRLSSNLHMIRTFNQRDSRKKLSSLVKRFDGQNMLAFLTGNGKYINDKKMKMKKKKNLKLSQTSCVIGAFE